MLLQCPIFPRPVRGALGRDGAVRGDKAPTSRLLAQQKHRLIGVCVCGGGGGEGREGIPFVNAMSLAGK